MGKGNVYFALPQKPTTKITVRAVPSEVKNSQIKRTFGLGCGKVTSVERQFHKRRKIGNGYRALLIENYKAGIIPKFNRI